MLLSISLLSLALPAILAAVQYDVPDSLAAAVDGGECALPDDFLIQNFVAQSPDNGTTLQTFDFTYADNTTNVTTTCHFNATSQAVPEAGRTSRFSCDDPLVQFIWQNATLTMVEGICPENNTAEYEASGSALISVLCYSTSCGGLSDCRANSSAIDSKFFSIEPIGE